MESTTSQIDKLSLKNRTFYMYDERMLLHKEFVKPQDPTSTEKVHVNPEIPDRIKSIYDHLNKQGLLEEMTKLEVEGLEDIEEQLSTIHSQDLIDLVRTSCEKLGEEESGYNVNPAKGEIYECKESYLAAKVSAATAITGLKKVLNNDYANGYCIIRPPGHHAYHNKSSGFCFFNNAALVAKLALSEPFNLKRVCIFDWDIHHGDGTQSMFYDSDSLLYVSLHRSDRLTFYPLMKEQQCSYIGEGKGKGFNVNVAWETGLEVDEFDRLNNKVSELGNNEYKYACDSLLFPIIQEYNPELIIVSCGFDSAIHDFLGWSNLTPQMYHYMTAKLMEICPKVLVLQEGGYNVDYLGQHAEGVSNALMGKGQPPTPADKDSGIKSFEEVDADKCKEWARVNVEDTRKHLAGLWKAAP